MWQFDWDEKIFKKVMIFKKKLLSKLEIGRAEKKTSHHKKIFSRCFFFVIPVKQSLEQLNHWNKPRALIFTS